MNPVFNKLDNIFVLLIEAIKESLQVDYGEYDNLGFTELSLGRIRMVVIAVFVGFIVGIYAAVLNKNIYGKFISSLSGAGCFSPKDAKTLGELGYLKSPSIKSAIRRGTTYRDVVRCEDADEYAAGLERRRGLFYAKVEAGEYPAGSKFKELPYKYDFEKAKFYIPEDKVFQAEEKFKSKRVSPVLLIILTIAMIAGLYVVIWLLPDLLMLVNNFVGMFTTSIN